MALDILENVMSDTARFFKKDFILEPHVGLEPTTNLYERFILPVKLIRPKRHNDSGCCPVYESHIHLVSTKIGRAHV